MKLNHQTLRQQILGIALPMTAETLLETLVGSIDVWIVAQLGTSFVTAVGVSNQLMALYLAIFMSFSVGSNAIVSALIGADKKNKAAQMSGYLLCLTVLTGFLLGIVTMLFGKNILGWMGVPIELMAISYQYSLWVGGTAMLMGLITVLSSILRVIGQVRFPLWVSVIVNLLNAVCSLLLTVGWGGIPSLGVVGVAIGTVLSRLVGATMLAHRLFKSDFFTDVRLRKKNSLEREMLSFLRVSGPVLAERLLMRGGQVLYMTIIVSISSQTYAAHTIAGTIEMFVYLPMYGFSAAATILIARSIGEKDFRQTRIISHQTLLWAVSILSLFAGIQFITATMLAHLFTNDTTIIPLIVRALQLSAIGQPFLAISSVLAGSLQGLGNSQSPFWSTVIGMIGIRLVGIYLFGLHLGFGITGIWTAILVDLIFRSVYLFIKWKNVTQQKILSSPYNYVKRKSF